LTGDQGVAGLTNSNGIFKTTMWAFPFEAITTEAERQELLNAALQWCQSEAEVETFEIFLPIIER